MIVWHSLLLVLVLFPHLAFAQILPPGDSQLSPQVNVEEVENQTRAHLERAQQLLADKRWDEAIDAVSQVLERDGDKLFEWPPPVGRTTRFHRFVPMRDYCHHWIGELAVTAPEALRVYRGRVDPLAERWLRQGIEQRDETLWSRIVDQMFASGSADEALLRLGEAALERGDYTAARIAWQRISPLLRSPVAGLPLWPALRSIRWEEDWKEIEPKLRASRSGRTLEYPDTDLDVATVLARLALVSALEGSPERARLENELLSRLFPGATGTLGGRSGELATLVSSVIEQSRTWPTPRDTGDWTSFAGNVTRQLVEPALKDISPQPLWTAPLAKFTTAYDRLLSGSPRVAEGADAFAAHPVVVGEHVFVNAGSQIRALRLQDGQPAWPAAEADSSPEQSGTIYTATGSDAWRKMTRAVGVPRFTLTGHDSILYGKVGPPITGQDVGETILADERGYLVGLDLRSQGRLVFTAALGDLGLSTEWALEGTPVVGDDGVIVTLRRRDTVRDQCHVACLDPRTGKPRWRRFVCAAEWPRRSLPAITNNLLTLRHDTVYVNSQLGAIAALNARTGAIRWLTKYPRSEYQSSHPDSSDRHFLRDPSPCLLYKDVVVAAPADSDFLFALDAATGQLLWTTDGDRARDVVHLLGVGDERLIASGDYLYWFDIYNGQPIAQFPSPRKEGAGLALPEPRGFGRGVLAGREVWWPTRDKLLIFPQAPARSPTAPSREIDLARRGASGGVLVLARDRLLIAGADRLTAFATIRLAAGIE